MELHSMLYSPLVRKNATALAAFTYRSDILTAVRALFEFGLRSGAYLEVASNIKLTDTAQSSL